MQRKEKSESPDHGLVVREAMTPVERGLTFVVLVLNLCLGVALILAGDFASLRPNDAEPDPVSEIEGAPPNEHVDERLSLANSSR